MSSDILLTFRTTFVNKKGEVVTKSKSIVMNYLKGWFLCDFLAAMPFGMDKHFLCINLIYINEHH